MYFISNYNIRRFGRLNVLQKSVVTPCPSSNNNRNFEHIAKNFHGKKQKQAAALFSIRSLRFCFVHLPFLRFGKRSLISRSFVRGNKTFFPKNFNKMYSRKKRFFVSIFLRKLLKRLFCFNDINKIIVVCFVLSRNNLEIHLHIYKRAFRSNLFQQIE